MSNSDLTKQEQANVRAAMRFLRARCGGWGPLSKELRVAKGTPVNVANGDTVSPTMAFRVARFAGVSVDDLLAGKYPPHGACAYCGHVKEEGEGDEVARGD